MSSMAEITKYCLWSPVTWGSDVPLFRVVAGDRNHRNLLLECGVFLFLKEIPPDLVYDIDRNCANTFLKFLLEKQKWPEVLLLLTRKVSGQPPLGDCLIKDCDLSTLDLCAILPHLKAWDQRRTLLLDRLIDHGGESQMLSQHRGQARGVQVPQVTALLLDFRDSFLILKKCIYFLALPWGIP